MEFQGEAARRPGAVRAFRRGQWYGGCLAEPAEQGDMQCRHETVTGSLPCRPARSRALLPNSSAITIPSQVAARIAPRGDPRPSGDRRNTISFNVVTPLALYGFGT
ncbi:hypothetical protein GCM10010378_39780 [Streptomyces viridochromogenes]